MVARTTGARCCRSESWRPFRSVVSARSDVAAAAAGSSTGAAQEDAAARVRAGLGQATSSRSRWTSAEIFSMVLCTVSSLCALRPERIHPRMRLDGGTSRRPARRSMSARSSGERRVATVTDLFGRVGTASAGRRWHRLRRQSARLPAWGHSWRWVPPQYGWYLSTYRGTMLSWLLTSRIQRPSAWPARSRSDLAIPRPGPCGMPCAKCSNRCLARLSGSGKNASPGFWRKRSGRCSRRINSASLCPRLNASKSWALVKTAHDRRLVRGTGSYRQRTGP